MLINADPDSGFQFPAVPGDDEPASFVSNAGEVMGGVNHLEYLALYYGPTNGLKGRITLAVFSNLTGTGASAWQDVQMVST